MSQTTSYKLTPKIQEAICRLLAEGNYICTACAAAGVNQRTYERWMNQGQEDLREGKTDSVFAVFVDATKRAEAEAIAERVARIRQAGAAGQWQADAWLLERKLPDRFGRRERLDHKVEADVTIRFVELT